MLVEWTDEDIKRGQILDPGFYRLRVEGMTEKLAQSQKSTNVLMRFIVIKNADTGEDIECAGVPVFFNFNSLMGSNTKNFAAAIAESEEEIPTSGGRFQLNDALIGREVEAFIGHRTRENGQVQNDVTSMFRKVDAGQEIVTA